MVDTLTIAQGQEIPLNLTNIPHGPGIYLYLNSQDEIIYVGKAVDLYKRVHQYFQDRLQDAKTELLVSHIAKIQTVRTISEFDALLLEAQLINTYQPKYNIIAKDDKSPLYVLFTLSQKLPEIRFIRKRQLDTIDTKQSNIYFGPFSSTYIARRLLRTLRRIIPYCIEKRRNGKPCFYTHIGLCDPCPSSISGMEDSPMKNELVSRYRSNILRLKRILSGNSMVVSHDLQKQMEQYAKAREFEMAAHIRNQLQALQELTQKRVDPMLYMSSNTTVMAEAGGDLQILAEILHPYYPDMKAPVKIECIDISNIMGNNATGSLVVSINGLPDTSLYRRFKIQRKGINDFAMIAEVIRRRFRHLEWTFPDLLIIDGGKGQVSMAKFELDSMDITLPIIGIAKRMEEIVVPFGNTFKIIRLPFTSPALHVIQRIRDEAHRFAITYHRHLRNKNVTMKMI